MKTSSVVIVGIAVGLACGCNAPDARPKPGSATVTFHVKDMGKRLNLLWDDWPNRVEEALSGLKGVGLVKEFWDQDRLFVIYDPQDVTVEQLLAVIAKEGFEAEVETNWQPPATEDWRGIGFQPVNDRFQHWQAGSLSHLNQEQ